MSSTFIDQAFLDALVDKARLAPRRRSHHTLHTSLSDPAQRMLVAMEPDSYVQPHCHFGPEKAETLIILRGRLGVILFEPDGTVQDSRELVPGGPNLGYDVVPGQFHSVQALESGTVFLEAKAGPYVPLTESEFAPWAPKEGAAGVAEFLAAAKGRFSLK